jgi:hypothetical protein
MVTHPGEYIRKYWMDANATVEEGFLARREHARGFVLLNGVSCVRGITHHIASNMHISACMGLMRASVKSDVRGLAPVIAINSSSSN